MNTNELQYWVALSQIDLLGASKMKKLYSYFPDFTTLWHEATYSDFIDAGLNDHTAEIILNQKSQIHPDEEMAKLKKENISVITIQDSDYPNILREIHNPPALLYYKGNKALFQTECLAIVGTRKMTSYGEQITLKLVPEISANQLTTVSGLALGVDTIVHHTTIQHNGHTIAVLGSSLDQKNLYPSSNRSLANNIIGKNGLIISEFPLDTMPMRHHFPIRNRIISGLSRGTLVIEAGESSGALITAKFALEQNREVFAVPGNITSLSSVGANNLIKQGATAINQAEDILEILNLQSITTTSDKKTPEADNEQEKLILANLGFEPTHFNDLRKKTNLNTSELNATLSLMELTNKIKNIGHSKYIINYQ